MAELREDPELKVGDACQHHRSVACAALSAASMQALSSPRAARHVPATACAAPPPLPPPRSQDTFEEIRKGGMAAMMK